MPSRDFVEFDPLRILSELRDVDHIVVGGFAAVLHGSPTVTADLDVMPRADEQNIALLNDVLAGLDTVVREPRRSGRQIPLTAELLRQTARSKEGGGQLRLLTSAGPLDVLWRLHDGRGYEDLVGGSQLLEEDDLRLRVMGIDDLIAVKAAIGRPQDRAVLPYLREIRRR